MDILTNTNVTQTVLALRVPGGFSSEPGCGVSPWSQCAPSHFTLCFIDQNGSRPSKTEGFWEVAIFFVRGVSFF